MPFLVVSEHDFQSVKLFVLKFNATSNSESDI